MASLNVFQWLRYGPWLAQVVVTRRCNLKCGYCTEYDRTSEPVPYDELALRLAKLAELRAWAVCLTGGEPNEPLIDALNRTVRACQDSKSAMRLLAGP